MAREYKEGYGVGNFQRLSKSALALWQPGPWNRRIIGARQSDISGEELKRSDMRIALTYQSKNRPVCQSQIVIIRFIAKHPPKSSSNVELLLLDYAAGNPNTTAT
jgi:hypothetical protein